MFLTTKDIDNEKDPADVSFEKVADDLLMVSIAIPTERDKSCSYWRLTNVLNMPPLEMGINYENGCLVNVTFFIDRSLIVESRRERIVPDIGTVLVCTDVFTRPNDYIDIDSSYIISIQGSMLTCAFGEASQFTRSLKNGRVEIYLDSANQIVGLSVDALSKREIELLESL